MVQSLESHASVLSFIIRGAGNPLEDMKWGMMWSDLQGKFALLQCGESIGGDTVIEGMLW